MSGTDLNAYPEKIRFEYRPTACCVCGKNDEELVYRIDSYDEGNLTFVRCRKCGLIYQNPRPTEESLKQFFTSKGFVSFKKSDSTKQLTGYYDYTEGEKFHHKMSVRRLATVNRMLPDRSKLKILKIAPGTGVFLKLAKDKGHEVTGVDVSEYFVAYAKEHFGIEMILSAFEDVDLGESRFDMVGVFGCISNLSDPRRCLEKIHHHLEDDGIVMLNYQRADHFVARILKSNYFLYRPPVMWFYTRKSLFELIRSTGFEVVRERTEVQSPNLAKLAYFSRIPLLRKLVDALKIHSIIIRIPIPGTYELVLKKRR